MTTPRTDEMVLRQERCDGDIDEVVPADFARILELEIIGFRAQVLIASLETQAFFRDFLK